VLFFSWLYFKILKSGASHRIILQNKSRRHSKFGAAKLSFPAKEGKDEKELTTFLLRAQPKEWIPIHKKSVFSQHPERAAGLQKPRPRTKKIEFR